jgi:hypothetical protein
MVTYIYLELDFLVCGNILCGHAQKCDMVWMVPNALISSFYWHALLLKFDCYLSFMAITQKALVYVSMSTMISGLASVVVIHTFKFMTINCTFLLSFRCSRRGDISPEFAKYCGCSCPR